LPTAQPALRAALEVEARSRGWPAMHEELAKVDPDAAQRLKPTDAQRIQRALEVHRHTGRSLTEHHGQASADPPAFESLAISLEPSDRAALHARIAQRFHAMLAAGLVEELQGLRARYRLDASLPSMRAVGYRQAWDTLEGKAPLATLEARGIAATRQLAKRQLTWLRAMADVERYDALRPDLEPAVIDRVARFLDRTGTGRATGFG
jgi:tRNA dimethylallyltransferase